MNELPHKGKIHGDVVLLRASDLEVEKGGIVIDEQRALSTPCHGYRMVLDGKVSELVWSPGVIGALSPEEKEKYCKLGITWGKPPEKLHRRLKILHEAGIFRK